MKTERLDSRIWDERDVKFFPNLCSLVDLTIYGYENFFHFKLTHPMTLEHLKISIDIGMMENPQIYLLSSLRTLTIYT